MQPVPQTRRSSCKHSSSRSTRSHWPCALVLGKNGCSHLPADHGNGLNEISGGRPSATLSLWPLVSEAPRRCSPSKPIHGIGEQTAGVRATNVDFGLPLPAQGGPGQAAEVKALSAASGGGKASPWLGGNFRAAGRHGGSAAAHAGRMEQHPRTGQPGGNQHAERRGVAGPAGQRAALAGFRTGDARGLCHGRLIAGLAARMQRRNPADTTIDGSSTRLALGHRRIRNRVENQDSAGQQGPGE